MTASKIRALPSQCSSTAFPKRQQALSSDSTARTWLGLAAVTGRLCGEASVDGGVGRRTAVRGSDAISLFGWECCSPPPK